LSIGSKPFVLTRLEIQSFRFFVHKKSYILAKKARISQLNKKNLLQAFVEITEKSWLHFGTKGRIRKWITLKRIIEKEKPFGQGLMSLTLKEYDNHRTKHKSLYSVWKIVLILVERYNEEKSILGIHKGVLENLKRLMLYFSSKKCHH